VVLAYWGLSGEENSC